MMTTCGLLSADNRKVMVGGYGNFTGNWVITAYDPVRGSILCHKLGKKLLDREVPHAAGTMYQVFAVAGQQSLDVEPIKDSPRTGLLFGVFAREAIESIAEQVASSEDGGAGVAPGPIS